MTKRDSSLANHSAAWAMSSTSTHGVGRSEKLLITGPTSSAEGSSRSGRNSCHVLLLLSSGVSVLPGRIALDRMWCSAASLARARIIPTTPCLAETYADIRLGPRMPASELVITTDPPPASISAGTAALTVFHTPRRFTSRTVRKTSSSASHIVARSPPMPAFAHTVVRPPNLSRAVATAPFVVSWSRTSPTTVSMRPPAARTRAAVPSRSASVGSG